jgi:Kef-type K+ transport system membrane component KefB
MDALTSLAAIWIGVFIAVLAARYTRLTPVLYYLAVGAVMVNLGILPEDSHPFVRGFSEVGIIVRRALLPSWRACDAAGASRFSARCFRS